MDVKRDRKTKVIKGLLCIVFAASLLLNGLLLVNMNTVKNEALHAVCNNLVNLHLLSDQAQDYAEAASLEEGSQVSFDDSFQRAIESQCAQIDCAVACIASMDSGSYRMHGWFNGLEESLLEAASSGSPEKVEAIKRDIDNLLTKLSVGSILELSESGGIGINPNYSLSGREIVSEIRVISEKY